MLNKHDKKYKEYLKLLERWDVVSKEIAKVPKVKLDKPYQRGWVIKYDLRPDIRRRKDIKDILYILDTGYHKYHFTTKVNVVKAVRRGEKTQTVRGKDGKDHNYSLAPGRRRLTQLEYDAIPDKLKNFFYLDSSSELYAKWGRKEYVVHLPEYWLVLKARPNMVTHLRGKAADLETEYAQIKSKLYLYWSTNERGYGGSHPTSNGRATLRAAIQKFKKGETEDIYNEKTTNRL